MVNGSSLHIALRAYASKTDKAGREYILHPLRVMAKMATDLEMPSSFHFEDAPRSAALLHDVIEESDITAQELLAACLPAEVVEAVQRLTRNENEEYQDFVARAKKNKLAAKVKIADIEDNIDVLRLRSLDEPDLARIKKYPSAWRFLKQL
jgi:(p)ppGpp synthase/HD superfamily hydrolase